MKRLFYLFAVAGLLAVSSGNAWALFGKPETKTEDGDAEMGLPEYKGLKHAVGVKDFENQAGWSGQWQVGNNLAVMLESALFDTGRFVVVEREKLKTVIEEQDLAASGRMAKAQKVAQTGKLRPAKYLATGAITEISGNQSGGDGGVRIGGFKVGLKKKDSQVAIIAKLVDTTTGELAAKKRIVGRPGGIGIKLGYANADFGGDIGGFKETPIGQAAQDAINQAAKWFAETMEEYPFEGSVIKTASSGQVIINRGSAYGLEEGQVLVMATKGEQLIDPDTGEILDEEEGEVTGKLKVAKVKEKVAYCEVLQGDDNPDAGTTVVAE